MTEKTLHAYKNENEYLKDLEDAILEYAPDSIFEKGRLIETTKNIDNMLMSFL